MARAMPLWDVLSSMIDRPGQALADLAAFPRWRWLLPVVLIIAALAISLALSAPLLAVQARRTLADQMARLPAEQARMLEPQLAALQKPEVTAAIAFGSSLLGLVVGWLLQATVLYFGVLIAGSELDFKRILAIVPWLSLPFALEFLVQGAFVATQGRLIVNQGLSYLVSVGKPLEDARNLAYVALGQLTLFRVWHWVLVYALLRRAARLTSGSAATLTMLYALLGIGGQLALAALGAMAG
ncbi:MAG: YIP1 family protein [Anaerolineae bacterium]